MALRRIARPADALQDRLNQFCDGTRELARVAGRYWQLPSDSPELPALEGEVYGLNHRLNQEAGLLGEERDAFSTATFDDLNDFSDAVTGGNFQVMRRPAEPQRYIRIEQRAGVLVREVRRFQRNLLRRWFW